MVLRDISQWIICFCISACVCFGICTFVHSMIYEIKQWILKNFRWFDKSPTFRVFGCFFVYICVMTKIHSIHYPLWVQLVRRLTSIPHKVEPLLLRSSRDDFTPRFIGPDLTTALIFQPSGTSALKNGHFCFSKLTFFFSCRYVGNFAGAHIIILAEERGYKDLITYYAA